MKYCDAISILRRHTLACWWPSRAFPRLVNWPCVMAEARSLIIEERWRARTCGYASSAKLADQIGAALDTIELCNAPST